MSDQFAAPPPPPVVPALPVSPAQEWATPPAPVGPPAPVAGYPTPAAYGAAAPTNTMAILSLVMAFVFPILGVVFGHKARKQIAATGEGGAGLATAGLVISYVSIGFFVLYLLFIVVVVAAGAGGS